MRAPTSRAVSTSTGRSTTRRGGQPTRCAASATTCSGMSSNWRARAGAERPETGLWSAARTGAPGPQSVGPVLLLADLLVAEAAAAHDAARVGDHPGVTA